MSQRGSEVVVVARGQLSNDGVPLAVRVALAMPLGGSSVRLFLTEAASLLGLARAPDLGSRAPQLERELQALIEDEEVPVQVERESLVALGLADQPLRSGITVVDRSELEEVCARARHCLVI